MKLKPAKLAKWFGRVRPPKGALFGFYSPVAARHIGYCIYTRPDGSRVQVTNVSSSPLPSRWPQEQSVGIVKDFVERIETRCRF